MLKYLNAYDTKLQEQIQALIEQDKLGEYLLSRYKKTHSYTSDKNLYAYISHQEKFKRELILTTAKPIRFSILDVSL